MTSVEVVELRKDYRIRAGLRRSVLRAVDGVSFQLVPGRTVALVGESGSGKSTVARILTRLETPTSGTVRVLDDAGHRISDRNYRHHVQMVFQDPFASLNPFHSVAHHLARPLRLHRRSSGRADTAEKVQQLLERVSLTPADQLATRRPHELSGGQRQRVAIARALAPGAGVLLADEPVSMLDVSIRLGVLNLLARLQREDSLAVLYITHDLATARHFSDEILVMYRGRIVERGPADDVILRPGHPYTRLLADAAPDPDKRLAVAAAADVPAPEVEAVVAPSPERLEGGCPFRDRCAFVMEICSSDPASFPVGPQHEARCWLHDPARQDPAQQVQPDSAPARH